MKSTALLASTIISAGISAGLIGLTTVPAMAQDNTSACLITKTDINPFFVKMKEGAQAKAEELGIDLSTYAGKIDGDHEAQVQAIESCIASGASGILIAASDTKAIVGPVQKARDAGLLVIALDTPLEPIDAAQSTFATDNFLAGELIGQWAAATLGEEATNDAIVAFLNLSETQPSVDVLRNQGFMTGFGIDTADSARIGDEDDPRIVGHEVTNGNEEGGRTAMESLLQINPDINVIYTLNEPAAAGAYEALNAFGKQDQALIVSIDGGCPGIDDVSRGVIGATSMQFPLRMASLGIEAIAQYAADGSLPENTEGLNFFDTGVTLVTDAPVDGIDSITSEEAKDLCWG